MPLKAGLSPPCCNQLAFCCSLTDNAALTWEDERPLLRREAGQGMCKQWGLCVCVCAPVCIWSCGCSTWARENGWVGAPTCLGS